MTYQMSHRIDMRHKYANAANTDIRKTFEKARRNAEISRYPVLDANLIPASAAQREKPDFSCY